MSRSHQQLTRDAAPVNVLPSTSIAGVEIKIVDAAKSIVRYASGFDIDADGSPHAYHPDDLGLDALQNARDEHGHYVGVVTINGHWVVQGSADPAPGFLVSTTEYQFPQYAVDNPQRYLDSEKVPYIVIPPWIAIQTIPMVFGSYAVVSYRGRVAQAVVGDLGPKSKIGEGSICLAKLLGIPSNPRSGGFKRDGQDEDLVSVEIHAGVPAVINGITYPLQSFRAR